MTCPCYRCTKERAEAERWPPLDFRMHRMFVCTACGNKRCPHAADHRNACTGSNAPGQNGSPYDRQGAAA